MRVTTGTARGLAQGRTEADGRRCDLVAAVATRGDTAVVAAAMRRPPRDVAVGGRIAAAEYPATKVDNLKGSDAASELRHEIK